MVAGGDLAAAAAVRAPYRVDVEGVWIALHAAAAGDALLDGGHDVAEERQVSPMVEDIFRFVVIDICNFLFLLTSPEDKDINLIDGFCILF